MKTSLKPFLLITEPWRYRNLIWQMSKREVVGRYRGSVMGLLWSFFNPIFMLIIYTFFFGVIYKARFGIGNDSKMDFAITLFAGLIAFNVFSECINRAPRLLLDNVNYIKKVVFPLEILPWVYLGASLFHAFISTFVLLVFFLIAHHFIYWTIVFLPLVNLPLFFLIIGLTYFLAGLGVYLRDVVQTVSILTTALLFLSPVFYSVTQLPAEYQKFIYFNPLTNIIELNREVVIWGKLPDWHTLLISMVIGLVFAWVGFYWFEKVRPGFADVV